MTWFLLFTNLTVVVSHILLRRKMNRTFTRLRTVIQTTATLRSHGKTRVPPFPIVPTAQRQNRDAMVTPVSVTQSEKTG